MDRKKFLKVASISTVGLGCIFPFNGNSLIANNSQTLDPLLTDTNGNLITTLEQWKKQRQIIKKRWNDYLGILDPNPKIPLISVIKEEKADGVIRQLVEYEGEPGITVWGYLLKPENLTKPVPGVVAMHSTSDNQMVYIAGVEKGKIVPFGFRLAQQGYVVFCPQCFLWHNKGERSYEEMVDIFKLRHPKSKGIAKMLFDSMRAVDVLVSLPEVDKERIGATGHSLGAKEVLYLGAFDDRVKVIVSNEGGIGIDFSNWDDIWYLGKEIHDFGHQQHEILSLNAPKPFLLIGGDSADGEISRPYVQAVQPIYELYGKPAETVQLFNHGTGHSVHPEAEKRTYEWIHKYL